MYSDDGLTSSSISSLNHFQNLVSPLGGSSGASIVLVLAARDWVVQQQLPLGTPTLVRRTGSVQGCVCVCYGVFTIEQLCILSVMTEYASCINMYHCPVNQLT